MSTRGIGGGLRCSDPPEESCSDADCPLHSEMAEAEVWRETYDEARDSEPSTFGALDTAHEHADETPRYEITHDGVTAEAVVVQADDKTIVQPVVPLVVRSGESFTITGDTVVTGE